MGVSFDRDNNAPRARTTVWDVVRVVLFSAGYGAAMWGIVAYGMGWS